MVKKRGKSQKKHGKFEEEQIVVKAGNVITIRYDTRHKPGIKVHKGR